MAEYKLKLEQRESAGKNLKNLRNEGRIPSVIYGGKTPVLAHSDYVATEKVLRKAGYHSPIDLDLAGKKKMVIVKSVAIDPVSRKIINIEFQAISAREVVEATTPIVIVNFEESDASKLHHFAINQSVEEIDVKAKPAELPSELSIDAGALKAIEDKLTLENIVLPEGVAFADKELDLKQVVASLYDPAAEAEKREAEEAAAENTAEESTETSDESSESAPEESEKTE